MVKKTVKVIVIYLFFVVLAVVINACDGRESGQYKLSEINSIALRLVDIKTNDIHPDEEYYSTVAYINLLDTVAIRYDSLGIDVTTTNEYFAQNFQFNNSDFIQSCYAKDLSYSFEKIVDIIVTSNKDYSSNFPKDSDLSGIMNITHGHYTNGISFESFLTSYDCVQSNVLLRFISPPDNDEVHTITIKYVTENNTEFETSQSQLLIKK